MKKQFFVDGLIYAICMVAASLLNLAVSALLVKFVVVLVAPDFFVLAIVRAIVQRNRGHISVQTELGKGSTFAVSFPIFDTEDEDL